MTSNTSDAAHGMTYTAVWHRLHSLLLGLAGHWDTDGESEDSYSNQSGAWVCSVVASIIIGLAGIVPLLIIPSNYNIKSRSSDSQGGNLLQLLLSFAVGGLLADVFLHLLPEAWTAALQAGLDPHEAFTRVGMCVLFGIFVFIIVEMLATGGESNTSEHATSSSNESKQSSRSNGNTAVVRNSDSNHHKDRNSLSSSNNGRKLSSPNKSNGDNINNNTIVHHHTKSSSDDRELQCAPPQERKIEVVGYLNLLANGIDNFAHGLAVAGSFMVSYKTGVLTTTAILIHEVPHEIGDFAILLSSGFSRWEAAKAQLYTSSVGLLGALFTLCMGSTAVVGGVQLYILGFTAGAFLNISLCSVLPQLLQEDRPAHSAAQMVALLVGTYTMSSLAC